MERYYCPFTFTHASTHNTPSESAPALLIRLAAAPTRAASFPDHPFPPLTPEPLPQDVPDSLEVQRLKRGELCDDAG